MSNCPNCGKFTGNGNHCVECAPITGNKDGCFVGSSKVLTPSGWKTISSIERDDIVLSYARSGGSLKTRRVIRTKKHKNNTIWHLCMAGGQKISTTEIHSFLTERGWKKVKDLEPNVDKIVVTQDGCTSFAENLISVSKSSDAETVFNLVVEGEHTFVVEGAVVHTYTHFRALRSLADNLFVTIGGVRTKPQSVTVSTV